MKIFFRTLFFLLILINSVNSEVIKNIKVDGNQRISTETIKIFTELELNKDYDLNELNDVVKRLYITNYFENINIKILNNVLYINVIENPIVQSLKFEGVKNKRILEFLGRSNASKTVTKRHILLNLPAMALWVRPKHQQTRNQDKNYTQKKLLHQV